MNTQARAKIIIPTHGYEIKCTRLLVSHSNIKIMIMRHLVVITCKWLPEEDLFKVS